MINHAAESEAQYDHLDDTGLFNAAEIRDLTGYETDGSNEDFTADAIAARIGSISLNGAQETLPEPFDGRNEKGGLNHVAYANRTEQQKAVDTAGIATVRAAKQTG